MILPTFVIASMMALNGLCLGIASVHAEIVLFENLNEFLSATGAESATGPLPNLGPIPDDTVIGDLTFGFSSPSTALFCGADGVVPGGDWYSPLQGNEIALSNSENLNIDMPQYVFAFGFVFVEPDVSMPSHGNGGNNFGIDSTFCVELFDGEDVVGTVSFNAPDDQVTFIGFLSDIEFDRVEIREVVGGADDEYFGEFFTSTVLLGDVNCDGFVNLLDVAPFIDLLSTNTYEFKADINQDGQLNLLDVGPFVDLLAGS